MGGGRAAGRLWFDCSLSRRQCPVITRSDIKVARNFWHWHNNNLTQITNEWIGLKASMPNVHCIDKIRLQWVRQMHNAKANRQAIQVNNQPTEHTHASMLIDDEHIQMIRECINWMFNEAIIHISNGPYIRPPMLCLPLMIVIIKHWPMTNTQNHIQCAWNSINCQFSCKVEIFKKIPNFKAGLQANRSRRIYHGCF